MYFNTIKNSSDVFLVSTKNYNTMSIPPIKKVGTYKDWH